MGKRKQYKEPRTNFTVRLFSEEKEELEKKSSACGMRMSEYLRRLVTSGGSIDTDKAKDRRDLINNVARLGNNINQITRIANTYKYLDDSMLQRVAGYMEDIKELMIKYLKAWT